MNKSFLLVLALVVIAAISLTACTSTPTEEPAAAEPTKAPAAEEPAAEEPAEASAGIEGKKVCYLIPDAANPFLSALTSSVQEKFAADGVEVLISGAEGDATKQFNQIENCISSGVDAMIIMAALEPVGVEASVLEAKDAGIKVMGVPVDQQGPYDAIMHTDQYEIGTLQAQMACDFINKTYPDAAEGSVEVAVIGTKGTELLKKRTEGMETVAEICPQANVVQYLDIPDPTITDGVSGAENVLTAHPDVKVFLITNDGGAQGVAEAIVAYASENLAEYAVFAGDVSPENRDVIQSCESAYRGSVAIGGGPEELAESTYSIVKRMISGEEFPAETLDPLVTVTCDEAAASAEATAEEPAEAVNIEGKKVCYLIPDAGNAFLSALTEGVKERFAPDGVEVLIYGAEGSATNQFNQIENCISLAVDGMIVMAALEPDGVEASVLEAKAAGIKVMGVPVDKQGPYDAIMHTDQFEIGTLMAEMACEWIDAHYPDASDESVEVAIISTKGTEQLKRRTEGMETIADCGKASLVQFIDIPETTIAEAVSATENIFTANPDVKVVLVAGDSGAQGVSEAMAAYAPDNLDEYAVFSGDISPENQELVPKCAAGAYRGAVAIGGSLEDLMDSTYQIMKGMISGGDFPAETIDPLTTFRCEE